MEKYLVVIDPWADIRRKPVEAKGDYAHDELRETQVLYNEALLYRDQLEDWYFVEAVEQKKFTQDNVRQGYPGWIRKESVTLADRPVRHDITVKNSYTFIRKDLPRGSEVLFVPPIGTRFTIKESTGAGYYRVLLADNKTGRVNRDDVNKGTASPTEEILRENIVTTAKLFLGVPYLWGGRSMAIADSRKQDSRLRWQPSAFSLQPSNVETNSTLHAPRSTLPGVDCSGLINLVFRVNNIDIPRDAHDQWMVAEKITHNKLKPGDLIFVSDKDKKDRIVHVMLYIGRKRFIEASETGSAVRIRTIREKFGIGLTELSYQAFRIDNKQIYFGRILRT
jgi:cell wall-associated NlpC family hydrolase